MKAAGIPTGVVWICKGCGSQYETPRRMVEDRCSYCLGAKPDPTGCELPEGFVCQHGRHWRIDDNGTRIGEAKCGNYEQNVVLARAKEIENQLARRDGGVKSFENFDASREPLAFSSCRKWARRHFPSLARGPGPREIVTPRGDRLVLVRSSESEASNAGCGKSHLLTAARLNLARRDIWVSWISRVDLGQSVNGMYSSHTEASGQSLAAFEGWVKNDVVIIDDLGHETSTPEKTSKILCELIDDRGNKPMAAASNLTRQQIEQRYGAATASRLLKASTVIEMNGGDFRGVD